ncbi:hypothetical protein IM792_04850 [Mucilaginibacter sp. JRF]|uniref:hypothetical protein n=1 Tax=Mucilaginibacter sp. JRF TaxID=2780088 RepID=UPI001881A9DF|nr:hypothetical protein [Mucilaginibacter sp. JRF]MBE9583768.1 hypothetical protein [Mucilaginibacter sp. JRF]
MKNNLLIALAIVTFLFVTSCKKDGANKVATSDEEGPLIPVDPDVNMSDVLYAHALTPGQYRIIAGQAGQYGSVDGNGANARFAGPYGIFVKRDGSLLVADFDGPVRHLKNDTVVTSINFPPNADGLVYREGRDIAATKDGSIGVQGENDYWVYRPDGTLIHSWADIHDKFGGIDVDPTGNYFWRAVFGGLTPQYPNGDVPPYPPFTVPSSATVVDAISAANNGVKYFATYHSMYKLTKTGVCQQIFTNFTFTNISSIVSSRDGYKIYVVDSGDIKVIANHPNYPKTITTLLSNPKAACIALSNSEKYIYFTTTQSTVGKLAL